MNRLQTVRDLGRQKHISTIYGLQTPGFDFIIFEFFQLLWEIQHNHPPQYV